MQVHHDLWHHTGLGQQHSWYPGAARLAAPGVNGARDSEGISRSLLPDRAALSSRATPQHAPVGHLEAIAPESLDEPRKNNLKAAAPLATRPPSCRLQQVPAVGPPKATRLMGQ